MKFRFSTLLIILLAIGSLTLVFFIVTADDEDSSEVVTETENINNNINTELITNENANVSTEKTYAYPGVLPDERIKNKKVRIKTDKGDIVFELYPDDAPGTVSNLVYLTEEGYYDGLTFHRVEPGFVIQGGDPAGNGSGGPGYKFEDEEVTKDYDEGIVAMANSGPDTNGSQFFIMLEDNTTLPKDYTIFGKVTEGMDVVKQIVPDDVMNSVAIE